MSKTLPLLFMMQLYFLHSLFSQTSEQLRANLYSFNTDSTLSLADGNLTMYDINNSNAIDGMDAVKLSNFSENFGLSRGSKTLVIERRHSITTGDTVFFKMWNMRKKNYKISLNLAGLAHPGLTGVLEDEYLNTRTELNLNGTNETSFSVTTEGASAAPDRFKVIFSLAPSSYKLLPVTFTGIKAYKNDDNTAVEWSAENEQEIARYHIEKSVNGREFFTVTTLDLNGKSSGHYKVTDNYPVKGNNFYRIKSTDLNGKMAYSEITKLYVGMENGQVSVYPNPVINGTINIHMADQPKGSYTARIINQNGQVMFATKMQYKGDNTLKMRLDKNTAKGNYVLEMVSPDNNKISRTVLIQ